ncbi:MULTISPECIES: RteC domain-containing protein [Weeksellaceae]|uniref:RteC domain-containing protein n=2 Tax=Elizabethkingia TaxID=308865 RepID=A0ABD5B8C2_ELIMR|nr:MULTISPECIES: RteC domain-containing protein [Weeksellaceae]MBS1740473.1 RteC domain-containing protein [Bacteroidota bacterium]MDQ8750053.1 RteC domain-containing protein [Elizabethkingia miricola]MDV3664401.1 tetracycline regulation of excision, RteC [Elizabethkingia anophelis]MPS63254.1 tetracycline regulation of excision, RteC [Chryseobacterium sp.]
MTEYFKKISDELEEEIKELIYDQGNFLSFYEKAIELILSKTAKLKEYILKKGFKNVQEEIHFFKYQKPAIISQLIYYNAIYKIEARKPYGAKHIRKYLNKELKKLKRFFDNNLDFYKYYRSNNSFLDENFFVRGKHDIKLWLDTYYFQSDQTFSTSHDYKVAKIIANDLIQVYIEDQLYSKTQEGKSASTQSLNWTGSKTAMIELIYALNCQGVFDNGNSDIRLIAQHFETTFNIDLGNFYQTFLELRTRKINRTKFLDELRDGLLRKMDEQDEK